MLTRRRKTAIISVLIATLFVISGTSVFAAGKSISVTKNNAPSTITKGKDFKIKGSLKSSKKIKRVKIGVVTANGKWTSCKYVNKRVYAKTFKLSRANSRLKFNKLKAGTYYYRVSASTSSKGGYTTIVNRPFTVVNPAPSPGKITLSGVSYPSKVTVGNGFYIKGKISSSKKIKSVTAGVVNSNGAWTSVKATKKPNAKTFKLKTVDAKLKFGTLPIGNYSYRVVVTTTGGTVTVINRSFSVVNNSSESHGGSAPVIDVTSESSLSGSSSASGSGVITTTGLTAPGTYSVGSNFVPVGIIQSTETINRVEIGIVYAPTNKWTAHKYDKSNINAKSFNVKSVSSALSFDTLPGGLFRYRIYVHTSSGVYVVLNHQFTVNPSNRPQAAVNWATAIANDNSFTYGAVPATSRVGCYYCGTNKKNKPKGYEKTYVCMTFVHAAYAHGAGDPELLAHCKGGKYCLSLNDKVFKEYSCWEKIGLCKDLKVADLLPGDVICWYADDDKSGHLSLYAGNGNIVDAGRVGWGADSIAVRKGAAANYLTKGANFSKKSFVMRYRK